MAATTADGSKADEAVKSNVDEVEKTNVDEAVKSNELEGEKSSVAAVAEEGKKVTLKSSDGELFEITHKAAALSSTIQHMIEDGCADTVVPLPNVNSSILAKVIEYCNKHAAASATGTSSDSTAAAAGTSSDSTAATAGTSSDSTATAAGTSSDDTAATASGDQQDVFDADFVKVDRATLFEIILAANYLDIRGLLDLSCQTVADMIKDLTVEQVREFMNIENDFTPEEEAKVREENEWAFEK